MQRSRIVLAGVGSVIVAAWAVAALGAVSIAPLQGDSGAAGAMPTLADAQVDLDNGRYSWCLQKIDRLLGVKPAPGPADQCALYSLRGECFLQEREANMAAKAFRDAAKAATDRVDIGTATSTAVLVERSTSYAYVPVTGKDHRPIPMLDKKKRHEALAALWADELAKGKPIVDKALASADTQVSLDAVPRVRELALYELAATGTGAATDGMIKSLQDHTEVLLAGTIAEWNSAANNMTISAMVMTRIPGTEEMPAHSQRKGLSGDEKGHCNDMLIAIAKLPEQVKKMCEATGAEPALYAADLAASDVLAKRLHTMLLGVFRPVRAATRPAAAH